jgi:hypothetical protein
MKITAHFHGILADWVGIRSAGFELSNDATYSDLIKEIKQRFGGNMPDQLWDAQNNTFHQKVLAFKDGRALDPGDLKLEPGEELTFFLMNQEIECQIFISDYSIFYNPKSRHNPICLPLANIIATSDIIPFKIP